MSSKLNNGRINKNGFVGKKEKGNLKLQGRTRANIGETKLKRPTYRLDNSERKGARHSSTFDLRANFLRDGNKFTGLNKLSQCEGEKNCQQHRGK